MKNLLIITMLLGIGYADCNESNWQEYYPDMQGCDLRYADLSWADLSYANLQGADLSYANLSGLDLSFLWGAYSNYTGANLSGANLAHAYLPDTDFTGADLTGATYDETTVLKCLNHTICIN